MKIACVDKTAASRLKLRQKLESAYESGRATIGHLPLSRLELVSKEELLLSGEPDVVVLGPEYLPDEAYVGCREIHETHSGAAILVFLSAENYNLRTLRRFERFAADIFAWDESPTRLLYAFSRLAHKTSRRSPGKMITVSGVKGGVGATSIVSGLAHAAETAGKTAVVLDLSNGASLLHYMGAPRWQSTEFATSLLEGILPDRALVERCIVTAPNGITLFLPPAGGNEVRELWLRDPKRLDASLACIEHLKDSFDLVLVDIAGSEGLLPFALHARAHARLLVTSNDPASVHLLSRRLSDCAQIPGDGAVLILVNELIDRGLNKDDIVDFMLLNKTFDEKMANLGPIPSDGHARQWIGTGNSFYTEGRRGTQLALEHCLAKLLNPAHQVPAGETSPDEKFFSFSRFFRALPYRPRPEPRNVPLLALTPVAAPIADALQPIEKGDLYEPPRILVNE